MVAKVHRMTSKDVAWSPVQSEHGASGLIGVFAAFPAIMD